MKELSKLKGRIVEKGMSQVELAKKLNLSVQALNAKLNGRANFNLTEVRIIIDALCIEDNEIRQIFLV
nr:MAG TPA: Protein of unknown function (DUF739) [Caudoviricetes sp.]